MVFVGWGAFSYERGTFSRIWLTARTSRANIMVVPGIRRIPLLKEAQRVTTSEPLLRSPNEEQVSIPHETADAN